jgi:hypothetical protein
VDCNGNKEGNGNSDKGGGQALVMATKRAMSMVTREVGNKEGNGNGGKTNGNGNEVGGQATATRTMTMRVAGK